MKKNCFVFAISIILVCIICVCKCIEDRSSINTVKCIINNGNVAETISLYDAQGIYYAFLPSYAKLTDVSMECGANKKIYLDEKIYDSNTVLAIEKKYNLKLKNIFGLTISKAKLIIMKSENIPAMSIHLSDGCLNDIQQDKKVKKSGILTLVEDNSEINYSGAFFSMHGRGNSSWERQKKPYELEFGDDVDLLRMGEAKKWELIANADEESNLNLRNKIVYDVANKIGLKYSIDSQFVDLYVDGNYQGVYLLTECVEVGENRVNITNLEQLTQEKNQYSLSKYSRNEKIVNGIFQQGYNVPNNCDDITGGYLIETEVLSRLQNDCFFKTLSGATFHIKSPAHASVEQVEYISELFQQIENSFKSEQFEQYIDVDSWAVCYLFQEIFANIDANNICFYKEKDILDSKIYAGPVWDFDLSMGSYWHKFSGLSPKAFYGNIGGIFKQACESPMFRHIVSEIYVNKFKNLVMQLCDVELEKYKTNLRTAYKMNQVRWAKVLKNQGETDLEQDTNYIKDFLYQRLEFLDNVWLGGQDIRTVLLISKDPLYEKYYYSVKPGETIGSAPELKCEGYKFLGYYEQETRLKYDPNEQILDDRVYLAKWERISESKTEFVRRILRNNWELGLIVLLFGIMGLVIMKNFFTYLENSKR